MKTLSSLMALALLSQATPAFAITDCVTTIKNVYAGTDGQVFATMSGGVGVYAAPAAYSDRLLAIALTAIATNRSVTFRLNSTGTTCTTPGTFTDWIGIFIN